METNWKNILGCRREDSGNRSHISVLTMPIWNIHLLETIEEMSDVDALQREVWPGSETDVVPAHLLITAAHNGGVVLGAFVNEKLIGCVFGFPGLESTP